MAGVRVAVYGEFSYRRDGEGLSSDQSFALFVTRLAAHVGRLVIVGRLDAGPGATHHRLRGDFEFCELRSYAALSNPVSVLRVSFASIPRIWRAMDGIDAVWLLGPNPLCILFAVIAMLRRRRVVLGVRQDIVALTRSRYGRGAHLVAAIALERIWRLLARRCAVVAVGGEIAAQYGAAREVVTISVSLVGAEDLASAESALKRDYEGTLSVLSVGRLEPQKNPLLLADVLAELRRRSDRWRLVVCGEGALQDQLAARLRELGVAEHADLRGYVAVDGPLAKLYEDAHAFLHVSFTEGFPQVLIEAFAAGLPTVATDVGGISEWAPESALLIPPANATAAADALERIASDPQLRRRLVEEQLTVAAGHTADAECARVAAALQG